MTDFTHHTPRLLTDEDAAADLAGVARPSLPPLPDLGPMWTPYWTKFVHVQMQDYALDAIRDVVSERDELASRVRELEGALWGCIAAIERTHHCTEADRLAAADKARAALNASKAPL